MNALFLRLFSFVLLLHLCIAGNAAGSLQTFNVVVYIPENFSQNSISRRDTSLLPNQNQVQVDTKSKMDSKQKVQKKGFNAKGFFLGLLLNVFGLIYVYMTAQENEVKRWAWVGLGAFVVSVWVIGGLIVLLSLPI